jgi:heme A synthase
MKVRWFPVYAWAVLVYNVGVILWGAYVRATGSGAGCGSHWPLCDGTVLPRSPRVETLVEFSHRLSSGLALILVVVLAVWAFRAYAKGHPVRTGAALSIVFIITEALVGAGLVLFELVEDNASVTRAMSTSVHLVNTFLLLAALTLTAWWARSGTPINIRRHDARVWVLGLGFLAVLILGISGAITALGDTLFPPESLEEGLRQDVDPSMSFMIRLRVIHPLIAVATSLYLLLIVGLPDIVGDAPDSRRLARAVAVALVTQLVAGVVNVLLLAPVWMQMLHLLIADLSWILLVLLAASALTEREPVLALEEAISPKAI